MLHYVRYHFLDDSLYYFILHSHYVVYEILNLVSYRISSYILRHMLYCIIQYILLCTYSMFCYIALNSIIVCFIILYIYVYIYHVYTILII